MAPTNNTAAGDKILTPGDIAWIVAMPIAVFLLGLAAILYFVHRSMRPMRTLLTLVDGLGEIAARRRDTMNEIIASSRKLDQELAHLEPELARTARVLHRSRPLAEAAAIPKRTASEASLRRAEIAAGPSVLGRPSVVNISRPRQPSVESSSQASVVARQPSAAPMPRPLVAEADRERRAADELARGEFTTSLSSIPAPPLSPNSKVPARMESHCRINRAGPAIELDEIDLTSPHEIAGLRFEPTWQGATFTPRRI